MGRSRGQPTDEGGELRKSTASRLDASRAESSESGGSGNELVMDRLAHRMRLHRILQGLVQKTPGLVSCTESGWRSNLAHEDEESGRSAGAGQGCFGSAHFFSRALLPT